MSDADSLTRLKGSWPADTVERREVKSLLPYTKNARTHSADQIAQIAASIEEFGFTVPLLVDEDGTLIAGHGRLLAAKKIGLLDVPVMVARGWSEAQRRAYVIADNKLALNAGWDDSLLRDEMLALTDLGFPLELTGFDQLSIDEILGGNITQADPEVVPELPKHTISVLGDVWILGDHRIICGDSTSAETVDALLRKAKPHLMVTDPPYGVEYEADWRNKAMRADCSPSDGRAVGRVENDHRNDWREAWALFPGDVVYVWHADRHASAVQASIEACDFEIRCQLIWAKQQFAIGRGDYHWKHEPCWYAVRKGKKGQWHGDRKQTTLWEIDKPQKSETGHSTQKPIECMRRPIENNSKPGDAVYEPFSGSGTTIIAGEMTGRKIYAVELNPSYVDIAVIRWQNYTGKKAKLESTGRTFAETQEERLGGLAV